MSSCESFARYMRTLRAAHFEGKCRGSACGGCLRQRRSVSERHIHWGNHQRDRVAQRRQKKRALQTWLQTLERYYADRLLSIDLETSHIWGELTAAARKAGRTIPASDGLIAATARRHGLHVMTRNTADFEPT